MHLAQPALGFSIKKLAKKGVKYAKKGAKVAVAPAYYTSKFAFNLAVKPVRWRINTIVAGRARKLAMERRRSNTPNKAEKREARAWAKQRFRAKGPHGHMLASLAGGDDLLGALGVAPAVIAAAVPVLAALATQMAKDMAKSGAIALTAKAQEALVPGAPTAAVEQAAAEAIEQSGDAATEAAEETLEGVSLVKKPAPRGLGIGLGLSIVATGLGIYAATR